MARRSQCSSAGDNPLHPNYLPPHYREEYRLAIDALVEEDLEGYYQFLQKADVVDFLSTSEIHYIQESVQAPQQSNLPEHRFLETGGDGSSDTYWPLHSDLDAPGLDLGWPQLHSFIGPTEVTTLVNPPEPDMPSIKEQARRLIKNAHQVIAIVMDMFTDVDIFHDILNAAMRNVAVYILLDELNVHHFLNMVSNCRVNLQSIQCLRVRTVSGITYHCRSGKSFKGQMMDRFLLTDCRAVLSGNYSFMWSFEKLHRCLAHLFLGQLVSTFDEEFRILFAQSHPLVAENVLPPAEDFSLVPKRQYPSDKTALYRGPRKFRSMDAHPEDWARHPGDEPMDVDWRMMPLKKKEPSDLYSRFPSQQTRMDPSFDQGPPRMPPMDSAFKRQSFAEGGHGRFSYPFLPQQGMPEPETQGRPYHSWQQPFQGPGQGKEADYSAYEKFWNQGYQTTDQYSEPGLPPEMDVSDNFDPVLNYLSTTRNVDFDQGSAPAADLPFMSSHPQRLTVGKQYPCQTSPAPSNPSEQKHFFQEPTTDRKDPLVKRGLRDWRISSYLSTYDNPEDEGVPLPPSNEPDPFEGPSNPTQPALPGIETSVHKIPNVREFKIPAIPRVSQLPGFLTTAAREPPKKYPDEPTAAVETTSTPSESSSTADGEKTEEQEQRETKPAVVQRDESFRRKYNMNVARSSRLRSSLIFNSLDQQQTPDDARGAADQQDEEGEGEQTKPSLISHVLGQRRSTTRGPFEWSRYIKSSSVDNADTSKPEDGSSKTGDTDSSKDKESSKDLSVKQEGQDVEQPKPSEEEPPKADQPIKPPISLFSTPMFMDMNDPDARLMFFKELAAKRKAAKAAEAEKSKEKAPMKPPVELTSKETDKNEEPEPQKATEQKRDATTSEDSTGKNAPAENTGTTASAEGCKVVSPSLDPGVETVKQENKGENDPSCSIKEEQSRVSADSETSEHMSTQPAATLPAAAEPEVLTEQQKPSSPAEQKSKPTLMNITPADESSIAQVSGEDENQRRDSTSAGSSSLTPSSVEVPPSSAVLSLDPNIPNPESVELEAVNTPPPLSEQHTGTELSSSCLSAQSSASEHVQPDSSGPQISQSPSPSSSAPLSTPAETTASNVSQEDLSSTPTPSILCPNVQETGTCRPEESSQESPALSVSQTESEANAAQPEPVSQLTSCDTPSVVDSTSPESAAGLDPNTSSLQSATEANSENSASTPSEKGLSENENSSEVTEEKLESFESSDDLEAYKTPPDSLPGLCSPSGPDLTVKSQNVATFSCANPEASALVLSLAGTSSPDASQTDTAASSLDAPVQVTPTSEPTITDTASCGSPLCSSSPEPPGAGDGCLKDLPSPSDAKSASEQVAADSHESPSEPTSEVPTEIESESVYQPSDLEAPVESTDKESQADEDEQPEDSDERETDDTETTNKINKSVDTHKSTDSEKTDDQVKQNNGVTSDEVVPLSPQSKQPKQSRYHSSTANVLSSSNLRDDTKLLLGQISANSQSRNEASKESPDADDEEADEDNKNIKSEKERGFRSLSRKQPKTAEEREKLLERIQSMRKERKVYSRFEMAP